MFVAGDILKVRPEYLSEDEKADLAYAELEYYVDDAWDGKVKLICKSDNFMGYAIYTWPDYTMYKVGHIEPEAIKNKLQEK